MKEDAKKDASQFMGRLQSHLSEDFTCLDLINKIEWTGEYLLILVIPKSKETEEAAVDSVVSRIQDARDAKNLNFDLEVQKVPGENFPSKNCFIARVTPK